MARKPVPMPTVRPGRRAAKAMPMTGPKKKSSGAVKPAKAQKPRTAMKLPTGERPKQLSILAKTVKSAARGGVGTEQGKPEILTASQAASRAGKIRDKEAKAKLGKASTSYSPKPMSKPAQGALRERAMTKQLSKYGMSKTEYGYKLNVGKSNRRGK
jgi:hypothetical protein